MAFSPSRRLVNPLLGVYYGIFASLFIAIVLLALMLEELGLDDQLVRALVAGGLALLLAAIALGARSNAIADLLFAGRRVPAIFTGLGLTMSTVGGAGLAALPGLFYLIGFDALFLTAGMTTGLVVFAILIAPYVRKFGAYSVPSYLALRFASPGLRVVAAAVTSVPLLLLVVAELKVALMASAWLTELSPLVLTLALSALLTVVLVSGGVRSLSWTTAAQAIIVLLVVLLSVALVALMMSQLPIPQLSSGRVIRSLVLMENAQRIPSTAADYFTFELPGNAVTSATHRFATPFSDIGQGAFVLAMLAVMAGIAGQPTLFGRVIASPSVYATRKSVGWAVCFAGLLFLTVSAGGAFLRELAMSDVAGLPAGQLPAWLTELSRQGLAAVDTGTARLTLQSFGIQRDAALVVVIAANGLPAAVVYAAMAALISAALAAAAAALGTLGTMLSEDILSGPRSELVADRTRRTLLRLSFIAVTLLGSWIALMMPGDPLELLLLSLALTGSTTFPVLLLSIWWKRCNGWGVMVGLMAGLGVAVVGMLGLAFGAFGLPGPLAAILGAPAALIATGIASLATPAPERNVLELVGDLRVPGGDTIYDREVRQLIVERRRRIGG